MPAVVSLAARVSMLARPVVGTAINFCACLDAFVRRPRTGSCWSRAARPIRPSSSRATSRLARSLGQRTTSFRPFRQSPPPPLTSILARRRHLPPRDAAAAMAAQVAATGSSSACCTRRETPLRKLCATQLLAWPVAKQRRQSDTISHQQRCQRRRFGVRVATPLPPQATEAGMRVATLGDSSTALLMLSVRTTDPKALGAGLGQLRGAGVTVLVACVHGHDPPRQVVGALQAMDWAPLAVVVMTVQGSWESDVKSGWWQGEYVLGTTSWHRSSITSNTVDGTRSHPRPAPLSPLLFCPPVSIGSTQCCVAQVCERRSI